MAGGKSDMGYDGEGGMDVDEDPYEKSAPTWLRRGYGRRRSNPFIGSDLMFDKGNQFAWNGSYCTKEIVNRKWKRRSKTSVYE